jgi:hypothetical protein
MHNNIAKHNIKRLACLLAATLLLTSCYKLVSAKTVEIRSTPESIEAGSTMLQDVFFSVSSASLRNIAISTLRDFSVYFWHENIAALLVPACPGWDNHRYFQSEENFKRINK